MLTPTQQHVIDQLTQLGQFTMAFDFEVSWKLGRPLQPPRRIYGLGAKIAKANREVKK